MELKRVYNNFIPLKGFIATGVYPWVFIRNNKKDKFTPKVERHESTHGKQQLECYAVGMILALILFHSGCSFWSLLAIPFFFWWYLAEWLIKKVVCLFTDMDAYYSVSFEQEAYEHEDETYYNDVRKTFAWVKYIFKTVKK